MKFNKIASLSMGLFMKEENNESILRLITKIFASVHVAIVLAIFNIFLYNDQALFVLSLIYLVCLLVYNIIIFTLRNKKYLRKLLIIWIVFSVACSIISISLHFNFDFRGLLIFLMIVSPHMPLVGLSHVLPRGIAAEICIVQVIYLASLYVYMWLKGKE